MTSTVRTPILSRNPPSQEKPGAKRQPVPNAGEFASLLHQTVMKPRIRDRGATDRPARTVSPAAHARNPDTEDALKTSAPAKEADSAAAQIPSWLAGLVVSVASPPVAVPEPATEHSGSEEAPLDSTDAGLLLSPVISTGQKASGSPRIKSPEVRGVSQDGDGNACKVGPAKTGSDRQVPAEVRSEPGPRDTESAPANDLSEQRTLASAPQPVSPDQPSPLSRVATLEPAQNSLPSAVGLQHANATSLAAGLNPDENTQLSTSWLAGLVASVSSPPVAVPEPATEHSGNEEAPSPDQPSPPSRVATLEPALDSLPSVHGMWPALQRNTMQTTHEVDKNACQAEQNLPTLEAAADSSRPAEQGRGASATIKDHPATVPAAVAEAIVMLGNHPIGHDFLAHTETGSTQPTLGQAVGRAIENTVVSLQHANATSLAVVLKPDENTQLSLHFKLQHGHVEAFAVLERGDFKSLTSEWAQLQSRLADQGISLAPLVSSPSRTTGFADGQFSSPKQQREDASSVDAPGPKIASLTARKSGARTVPSTTGREWWA